MPSRKSKALLRLSMIFVNSFRIFSLFDQRLVDQVSIPSEELPSLSKGMHIGENQKDQVFLWIDRVF